MHRATLIIAALLCGCGSNEPEPVQDSIDRVINDDHLPDDEINALCQLASDTLRQRLPSTAAIDLKTAAVRKDAAGWSVVLIYDIGTERRTCCVLVKPLSDADPSPAVSRTTTLYHEPPQPLIDFHAQR